MSGIKLHLIDIAIIVGYLVFCVVVGLRGCGVVKTMRDYNLGGKPFPTTVLIITTIATAVTGTRTVGITGKSYDLGLIFIIPTLIYPFTYFILSRLLLANFDLFKRKKFATLTEIMAHWYGKTGLWVTNIFIVIGTVLYIAAGITALGYLFHYFLGISEWQGAFLGITVITVYSSMGGIRADVITDVFQFIIFMIALPIIFKVGMDNTGGLQKVFAALPKTHLSIDSSNLLFFLSLVFFAFIPNVDIPYIQRSLIAKDKPQLTKTFNVTGLFLLPFSLMMTLLGLVIYVINPNISQNIAMYYFIENYLSPGFVGLLITGVLAVMMSTADSYLNAISTVISKDIFGRLFPKLLDSKQLLIARISCVFVSAASLSLAYTKTSIVDFMWLLANFWCPIVGFPLLAGLMGFRLSERGFAITIFAAVSSEIVVRFFTGSFDTINVAAALGTTVICVYFANRSYKKKHPELIKAPTKEKIVEPWFLKLKKALLRDYNLEGAPIYLLSSILMVTYIFSIVMLPLTWDMLTYLRIGAILLCFTLLLNEVWVVKIKQTVITTIWYITLCFCLPLLSSYLMLTSGNEYMWMACCALSVLFLYLITTPLMFGVLTLLGGSFGYLAFIASEPPIFTKLQEIHSFATFYCGSIIIAIMIYFHAKRIADNLYYSKITGKMSEREEALRIALNVKKSFLGKLNHEIRTSLHGIVTLSTEISQDTSRYTSKEKDKFIHMIANSGQRLSKYASDILSLANYKTGELSLEMERKDIRFTIRDAVKKAQEQIDLEGRNIKIDLEEDLLQHAEIDCDSSRILEVLSKLLLNAIKYGENGKILVQTKDLNTHVMISIADEGIGVPDKEKLLIFEPFTESSRTKNEARGTGLGLSICNEIVFLHKGHMWVEDNKPKGSKFVFTLPYRQHFDYETLRTVKLKRKRKIVVVDDEEASLTTMELILTSLEHTPVAFSSGTIALNYLKEHYQNVDLVLLDLMMPEMDGIEFLGRMRQNKKLREIPVVIQSGFTNSPDITTLIHIGAEKRVISKPYMKKEVSDVIDSLYEQIETNKKESKKTEKIEEVTG